MGGNSFPTASRHTGCHVFVHKAQRTLVAAGYRSRHTWRYHSLTFKHYRHMLANSHQKKNHLVSFDICQMRPDGSTSDDYISNETRWFYFWWVQGQPGGGDDQGEFWVDCQEVLSNIPPILNLVGSCERRYGVQWAWSAWSCYPQQTEMGKVISVWSSSIHAHVAL